MTAEPLQFLLMVMAGWVNRRQLEVIDYLKEEDRVLREQLGGKRVRFADDQRRRLAAKGQLLGRRVLDELASLMTPETIVRRERLGGLLSYYHRRAALSVADDRAVLLLTSTRHRIGMA